MKMQIATPKVELKLGGKKRWIIPLSNLGVYILLGSLGYLTSIVVAVYM